MRDRSRIGLVIALVAVAGGCAAPPPVARTAVLQLTPYVGRLTTLTVTIAGQPLHLLFDTGAGLTLVTPDAAMRLVCAPAGRSVGWRMNGERIEFPLCAGAELAVGDIRRALPAFGIFDLGKVLPPGLPPLDGVLGLDAFLGSCVTLQLGARRLELHDDSCDEQSRAGWTEAPMRVATGVDGATAVVFLGASAPGGRTLWLELDSGNLDAILLAPASAAALQVSEGGGDAAVSLTFRGLSTAAMPVTRRELLHDGALNASFLERYDVRLDLGRQRAWLRPSKLVQ